MADDASALLVGSGLVTTSALEDAHARVLTDGGTVGEHLVAAGAITDEALTELYRAGLHLAAVNPNALARLPVRVVATVPADLAVELRVIPVALDGEHELTLAMSDPLDRHAFDEIAFFTGMRVVRAVATQMQIAWCLAHYYGHVSPLGQRLLQVTPPSPAPAPPPRTRGLTGQVDALRRRAIAPVTGPFDAIRPVSGPIVLAPVAAPAPAPAPAPASDPDPSLAPTLDAVPDRPRARSVSGEIRVQPARAASILPPAEAPFEDDAPSVSVEVSLPIEDQTAPHTMPVRRRKAKTDPPELAARAGEVGPAAPLQRTVDSGPHIIVADDALAAAAPPPVEDEAITLRGDGRPAGGVDTDSHPILLERKRPDAAPDADDDEVVVLEAKKPRPSAAPRGDRHTQVGLGVVPPDRTTVDTPAAPAAGDDTDETLAAPPAPVVAGTPPTPDPDDDDDEDPVRGGRTTAVMSVVELDDAIPARSAEVLPAHLAARRRDLAHDALDDGWGPPGTTIPPPLLGAAPGSDDDAGSDRIPLDAFDAPLVIAPPAAATTTTTTTTTTTPAPAPALAGPSPRATEDAMSRLLALIRQLEHAGSRDEVVGMLIDHLVHTHHRAGFFVVKPGAIKGSTELGVFAVSPRPALLPYGTLPLERPSTLRDVVGARVPYRGPTADNLSRAFLASALGACPAEILLVPITVRDRVVGLLFGDHRKTHTFDDQLTLASRAAGQALERVLKTRRG